MNATEVGKLLKQKQKEEISLAAEPRAAYGTNEVKNDTEILQQYLEASEAIKQAGADIKVLETQLEKEVLAKYDQLDEDEIKDLVLNHKWKAHLETTLHQEQDKISQALTQRIQALAERYATTLTELETELTEASGKVAVHLQKMGLEW